MKVQKMIHPLWLLKFPFQIVFHEGIKIYTLISEVYEYFVVVIVIVNRCETVPHESSQRRGLSILKLFYLET